MLMVSADYCRVRPFSAKAPYPTALSLTCISKLLFLNLIPNIRDFGIHVLTPVYTKIALSVSRKMRALTQIFPSFGYSRLYMLNGHINYTPSPLPSPLRGEGRCLKAFLTVFFLIFNALAIWE